MECSFLNEERTVSKEQVKELSVWGKRGMSCEVCVSADRWPLTVTGRGQREREDCFILFALSISTSEGTGDGGRWREMREQLHTASVPVGSQEHRSCWLEDLVLLVPSICSGSYTLLPPLPQGSLGPEGRDSMETFDLELAFQGLSLSAHGLVGLIQWNWPFSLY